MSAEHLRQLPEDECRGLLATTRIGRVGVSVKALPAIFPVRFTMVDDHVVFRAARDTLLAKVVADAVVAFEADAIDDDGSHGWSVLVVGRARLLDTGPELDDAWQVPLRPWTVSTGDSLVCIATDTISGRAITES